MSQAALIGASVAGGALSGLADSLGQMYQWQQYFKYQQNNQNFLKDMLQSKQQFTKTQMLLNAQLRGINVPSSILSRNASTTSDHDSIGSAGDLLADSREAMNSNSVNDSNHATTDTNDFPATGPYAPSISGEPTYAEVASDSSSQSVDHTYENVDTSDMIDSNQFQTTQKEIKHADIVSNDNNDSEGTARTTIAGIDETGPPKASAFPSKSKNSNSTPTSDYILSRQYTPSSSK